MKLFGILLMKSKLQFEKRAYEYNKYAHVQENLIKWGLDILKPSIKEDYCVLELGASTGLLTRFLKTLALIIGSVMNQEKCSKLVKKFTLK